MTDTNRLYPNWEQISKLKNPLTAGEIKLIEFLDNHLPKDKNWKSVDKLSNYKGWLIFAQPFLNGTRPDVIVYNPFVGMVIFEVKDWNKKHYEWKNSKLYVSDARGSYEIKSPAARSL